MLQIQGSHNIAKVFIDTIDNTTYSQIQELVNSDVSIGSNIAIMPDCHAGAGCVIGTTMTIKDRVCPNLVGVDIGCGMRIWELGNIELDLPSIDNFIKENIPSGCNIFETPLEHYYELENLRCTINIERAYKSIGTLGGGNHFIEIDVDDEGNKYLVVHSGSRHLGLEVANYYQKIAEQECNNINKQAIINELKLEHREKDIQKELSKFEPTRKGLEYLEGNSMQNYLHDMKIVQDFASVNRKWIIARITNFIEKGNKNFNNNTYWETVHNYIDVDNMILRKGSVSARKGERLLIPINMRDGSIIAVGKGNKEYNYSAPHGAGRVMSRSVAKREIPLDLYQESMKGIYSTSVNTNTLDESPFAYKDIEVILENIQDSVEIEKIIKPIYNFKAS